MKKTFISLIAALSIAVYSLGGFTAFADVTVPYEDKADSITPGASAAENTGDVSPDSGEPQMRSFDGTNADGTLDISGGVKTTLTENGSKYNGMTLMPLSSDRVQSRYSTARVALSPDIADTKYAEAAELLGALGIMVGDAESGAFRPNDAILRSEMAKVAVYSIGLEDVVKSSNGTTKFPDVPAEHWATGAINTADQQGLVVGDTEGTFRPDDSVTFEEAVTIIVRALGYEPAAQDKGGYPTGYMYIASSNQLLRGIDAVASQPAKRGDIAQLVFNALTVNLMEQVGFGSNVTYEVVDKTLLYDKLNVEKAYGQITGTDETTLTGGATTAEDRIQIGDTTYLAGDTNAAQLLGYNVLFYARIDKQSDEKTLILVSEQPNKNNSLTLNSSDIVDVTGDTTRTVEYWADRNTDRRTRTTTIKENATYIYNGKFKQTVSNDELKPESGNLVLIDTDVNGVYDIVFVNHFTNLVVDTVSEITGRVTDKYLNGSLVFDKNNADVKYSIIKNGAKIDISELKEWNVLSYTISEDQNLIKAYVSDASVTGSVNEISDEGYRIGENPTLYEKAASYPNEIKLRDRGTFYLDIEDKIAAVNTRATSESAITTNYAYMVDAALRDNFDKTAQFKLFTKAGETVILDSAAKLRLNDSYAQTPEQVVLALGTATGGVTPQLIIYEANSEGKVTAIETAENGTATGAPNPDRFTMNISKDGMIYKRASGKLGNVGIGEDTIIFDIPASAGTDTDKYSIRTQETLSNNSSYDAVIYDLQENYTANAVIITSSTGVTAAESPITVVSYLAEVQNEDFEYTDKLYGYSGGETVEIMAADKSVLRKTDGTPLKSGDIIQYKTNASGEIDGITILFDSNNKTEEFLRNVTSDLTTAYGRATKKFSGSVNVQIGDSTYNYATGDAIVYLYDSSKTKNNISVVSAADIELYEKDNEARLFVKLYQDAVQEMVIVK